MKSILNNFFRILLYGSVFYLLDRFLSAGTIISRIRFNYSHPFIVFISVIRGPWIGGFSFALGEFLTEIGGESFDWLAIICSFLNCFLIGKSIKNDEIYMGFFDKKDIIHFNNTHLLFNLICWTLIYPLVSHFLLHSSTNLFASLSQGFWKSTGFYISDLIAATLFLMLYSRTRITEANFYRN